MKLGCCTNMIGTAQDALGTQYIPMLPSCGYDYIELAVANVMQLSESGFEALLKTLQETKISCIRCNNFLPASVKITGPRQICKSWMNIYPPHLPA